MDVFQVLIGILKTLNLDYSKLLKVFQDIGFYNVVRKWDLIKKLDVKNRKI